MFSFLLADHNYEIANTMNEWNKEVIDCDQLVACTCLTNYHFVRNIIEMNHMKQHHYLSHIIILCE